MVVHDGADGQLVRRGVVPDFDVVGDEGGCLQRDGGRRRNIVVVDRRRIAALNVLAIVVNAAGGEDVGVLLIRLATDPLAERAGPGASAGIQVARQAAALTGEVAEHVVADGADRHRVRIGRVDDLEFEGHVAAAFRHRSRRCRFRHLNR